MPEPSVEVLTRSAVTLIDLPQSRGRVALITLTSETPNRPCSLGPAGLASLDAAIDAAEADPDVVAVGITGGGPSFCVGADLGRIQATTSYEEARAFSEFGHRVFRRLGELTVPTFALINGPAMGGGLELALHCTFRTVSSSARSLSLPEVHLGLVPGWGGTYLMPHLIGPGAALQVIVANPMAQNRQLSPTDAVRLGIADVLFDSVDFIESSLEWMGRVADGAFTVERVAVERSSWNEAVADARAAVDKRLQGATPAPYRACDLVDAALDRTRDEAFAAEEDSLANLAMGDDFRASLYAFTLVQKRGKRAAGAPDPSLARPVGKVGIVGAGLMASQLAVLFARSLKVPVVMTDVSLERAQAGLDQARRQLSDLQSKGRISLREYQRVTALIGSSVDQGVFSDADFVLEAVSEDLALKKAIFEQVENVVSDTCVLATNTSSLSVAGMAEGLRHPERVVGFHFFNPVSVMALLEIAPMAQTDDATTATAFAVGQGLRKTCVLAKDEPGFVANRLLVRFLGETWRIVDEGTPIEVVDRSFGPMGMPMSPYTLLGLVGPAVAFHTTEALHAAFPDRFDHSANMERAIEAGVTAFWVKDDKGARVIDPRVPAMFDVGTVQLSEQQVLQRVLDVLADEARIMLEDGVVAAAEDLDLCMILGVGWPLFTGGLTPYLDRTGAAERATGRKFHTN